MSQVSDAISLARKPSFDRQQEDREVARGIAGLLQESGRQRDLPLRQRLGLLEEAHQDTHDEIVRIRTNIMGRG